MTLSSRLAVLPAPALAVIVLAGCAGDKATLATFAGTWQGHTRGLKITRAGSARESIYSGCCHFAIAVRFRLSHPRGTPDDATATATITAVRTRDRSVLAHPPPYIGESRRIRLRDGVITETLTGTNYCSPAAKHWTCGA